MGWFSKKAQPKTDDQITYPETLARVDENVTTRPVHFDRDENIHHRPEGVDADEYERAVYLSGLYQRSTRRPPQSIGALIPVGDELPISQYTRQPYDPAWSVWVGGGPRPKSDNPLLHRRPDPDLDIISRRH